MMSFGTRILKTGAVLVFATERKNNVDPCPRSQKLNYIQFNCQVTCVHLICQKFMNDLLTEQG